MQLFKIAAFAPFLTKFLTTLGFNPMDKNNFSSAALMTTGRHSFSLNENNLVLDKKTGRISLELYPKLVFVIRLWLRYFGENFSTLWAYIHSLFCEKLKLGQRRKKNHYFYDHQTWSCKNIAIVSFKRLRSTQTKNKVTLRYNRNIVSEKF